MEAGGLLGRKVEWAPGSSDFILAAPIKLGPADIPSKLFCGLVCVFGWAQTL